MITLGISTSSGQFSLVLGNKNNIIYNSNKENNSTKDISLLLKSGLKHINKSIQEIQNIIINIGPGGTSSVRTGVAFANSLSYSLKIPVHPVSSLELAGIEIWEKNKIPVLSSVKSIKNNAFIGFFKGYNDFLILYGKINEIIPELTKDFEKIAVLGYHRPIIKEILESKSIIDTEQNNGDAEFLIKKQDFFSNRALMYPKFAIPITEQNI